MQAVGMVNDHLVRLFPLSGDPAGLEDGDFPRNERVAAAVSLVSSSADVPSARKINIQRVFGAIELITIFVPRTGVIRPARSVGPMGHGNERRW